MVNLPEENKVILHAVRLKLYMSNTHDRVDIYWDVFKANAFRITGGYMLDPEFKMTPEYHKKYFLGRKMVPLMRIDEVRDVTPSGMPMYDAMEFQVICESAGSEQAKKVLLDTLRSAVDRYTMRMERIKTHFEKMLKENSI